MRSSRGADLQVGDIELTASFANGLRSAAAMWLRAVEEVTSRDDLVRLTVLPWARVLSGFHLLRPTMAHCPSCLDEMAAADVVYEPLLWAIRLVTVCPKHERPLQLACRQCGRSQPAFRWHGRPGICWKCGGWLGAADASLESVELSELAVSQSVASMLLSTPRPEIDPAAVGNALNAGIAGLGLTQSQFARAARVGVPSLSIWRRGLGRMGLPAVVALCAAGAWEIGPFLDGRLVAMGDAVVRPPSPSLTRQRFDWQAIRQAVLRHGGDDPPITQGNLAAELCVHVTWLRKRLPEETQGLVDRRRKWQQRQALLRQERLVELVTSTTLRLLESGRAASAREVECYFPSNVSLRQVPLMAAWRQTRLDWHRRQDPQDAKAA
jgi:hypothetical protein